MKTNRPRFLPYPQLRDDTDDIGSINEDKFSLTLKFDYDGVSKFTFAAEISLNNKTIEELIEKRKAVYGLLIECPRTAFRRLFRSDKKNIEYLVNADDLFGNVEISAFVIAESDLKRYRVSGQNSDYGNSTFRITSGDILATCPHLIVDASRDFDPLNKISSIIDIRKGNEESAPMRTEFTGQKIAVILSEKDFSLYVSSRRMRNLQSLLTSTVIFPVMLHAIQFLQNLKRNDQYDEFYNEHRWCRSIARRLEQENLIETLDSDGEAAINAVQIILKSPVNRALNEIKHIYISDEN